MPHLGRIPRALLILAAAVVIAARLVGRSDGLFSFAPDWLLAGGVTLLGAWVTVTFVRRPLTEKDVVGLRVTLLGELLSPLPRPALRVVLIVLGLGITALGLASVAALAVS